MLLFVAALPVIFTAEFSDLRGDAALCVEHMAPDALGFWDMDTDKLVSAKQLSAASLVVYKKMMLNLNLEFTRFRAVYAWARTAAMGWTFCEKMGPKIGEKPEVLYAALRHLGVLSDDDLRSAFAGESEQLLSWLVKFGITLSATCVFGAISHHYNILHSGGEVRSRTAMLANVRSDFADQLRTSALHLFSFLNEGAEVVFRPQGQVGAVLLKQLDANGCSTEVATQFISQLEIRLTCERTVDAVRAHVDTVVAKFMRNLALVQDKVMNKTYISGLIMSIFEACIYVIQGGAVAVEVEQMVVYGTTPMISAPSTEAMEDLDVVKLFKEHIGTPSIDPNSDYHMEWREDNPDYGKEWLEAHPDYMKDRYIMKYDELNAWQAGYDAHNMDKKRKRQPQRVDCLGPCGRNFRHNQFPRQMLAHLQESGACAEAWTVWDDEGGLEDRKYLQHRNVMKKYKQCAREEQPLNWAQCDTCDKWRVVPDVITGPFKCAMVVLSCDTAEDEEP